MAKITVSDIVSRLEDGKLRPEPGSTTYQGMTLTEMAEEYLRRCAQAGVCAGCYNTLNDEDREFSGDGDKTNQCISCACW